MTPLVKLIRYARGYRTDIILASLYSFLNKVFDIFPEVLIGIAVDVVVKRQDSIVARLGIVDVKMQIVVLGLFTGLVWILESTFQYLYTLKWSYLAQNIQHDLRRDAYNHLQSLPLSFIENEKAGNIASILNDDINQLERFVNDGVNQIIQIIGSIVIIGTIFFFLSASIAVLTWCAAPIIFVIIWFFKNKLASRYLHMRNDSGNLSATLNHNLQGLATIKSFNTENYESVRIEQLSNKYSSSNKTAVRMSGAVTPVVRMAVMFGFLTALIYGGIQTIEGIIPISSYTILIFLSQRMLWPLTYLGQVTDMYQRSMASIRRLMNLLEVTNDIVSGEIDATKAQLSGDIVFRNVDFTYHGREQLLSNLNLTIGQHQKVAFVGATGSGKSTLVKLLLRFYDVQDGKILLNNYPIDKLTFASLRQAIAVVAQDNYLIDANVLENIRYGSFDATDEMVYQAARLAFADGFIGELPSGYLTEIGERGQRLSGGQKQRIALARALLKDSPILILDEATSALDNHTEKAIQKAIFENINNKTVIIIAHRLSTIVASDVIFVVDNGNIVEKGSHHELLALGGAYAKLWNIQLEQI